MPHNRILLYQPTTLDYCKELETIDRSECQSWFNELLNVFASFPDMTPTPYKNSQLPGKVIGQKDFESLGTGYRLDTLELSLNSPRGLAVDGEGNLWVADSGNHRVLEYDRYP